MATWTPSLLETISERLKDHRYWTGRSCSDLGAERGLHLVVFAEPFLRFVLEGKKTVDSRFSTRRCAPYEVVHRGDVVLIKRSGGPIVAVAEVGQVWFYEIDKKALYHIKSRFGPLLCADDPGFWESKTKSCYATLMQLDRVQSITPVPCPKRDRRSWVVLSAVDTSLELSFDWPTV
jgi:hypothetical protein